MGFEQREIKLVITVAEGDDVETDAKTAAIFGPSYRIAFHGCAVAIDGTVSSFRRGSFGVQGGGPDQLTEDELERSNRLIGQLPDDNSKLPPVGHRIVLQVAIGSEILVRVYDLANAPETILEILLTDANGIGAGQQSSNAPQLAVKVNGQDDVISVLLHFAEGSLSLLEVVCYNFPDPVPCSGREISRTISVGE